jgi:hypothetical protein
MMGEKFPWGDRHFFTYSVYIDGKEITSPKLGNLERLTTEETTEKASSASVTILDPEYDYIDKVSRYKDRAIVIKGGWTSGAMETWFTGLVTMPTIDFPEDGIPRITFECSDKSVALQGTEEFTATNLTKTEAIRQILGRYGSLGLRVEAVDSKTKMEQLSKGRGVKDIDYIRQLASEIPGYTFYVIGNNAYFGPRRIEDGSKITLAYKKSPFSIIELGISFQQEIVPEVTDSSLNLDTGETDTVSSKQGDKGKKVGQENAEFNENTAEWKKIFKKYGVPIDMGVGNGSDDGPPVPTKSTEDAQAQVSAMQGAFNFRVRGEGECLPEPNFKSGTTCIIDGIGSELSGSWYVIMVRNTISSNGWRQNFAIGKDAPGVKSGDKLPDSQDNGKPSDQSKNSRNKTNTEAEFKNVKKDPHWEERKSTE